jgi:hypothetical protein
MPGALDCERQRALMACACPCHPAGDDLRALTDIAPQARDIFIINVVDFIDAKRTDFPAAFASATGPVGTVPVVISLVSQCQTSLYGFTASKRQIAGVIVNLGEILHPAA